MFNPELLTSHTAMGYVRYNDKLIATYTTKGWVALESESPVLDAAVKAAITGCPSKCPASELAAGIVERMVQS